MRKKTKLSFFTHVILLAVTVWLAILVAPCFQADVSIFEQLATLPEYLYKPFQITWLDETTKYILVFVIAYTLIALYLYANKRNTRNGEEHGSSKWGDVARLNKNYAEKRPENNIILTENFRIGLDIYKHQHNLNTLVVGGSGSGKTRSYVMPNILQANCSYIITDPKGEILKATGGYLQSKGYGIRVFDLTHPEFSMCYNPFVYVEKDDDILSLISSYIRNTTQKNAQSNDPFWEKAETALLQALMLYLWHEAPPEEQNFEMILDMLRVMSTTDEYSMHPVDFLFSELRKENPNHIALKSYDVFKTAPAKTANSVVVTAGVRFNHFGLSGLSRLTARDEMNLVTIGQKKTALYCVIPDIDTSYSFLASMLYTQVFQQLERFADEQDNGKLPVHVHCIMDEFANIPIPESFEKVLATARSRSISISIILQDISQLKSLFDKRWESIMGNCDEFLFLGGNEQSSHESVSKLIGKETIDTNSYGLTRGRNGHYSTNYQKIGRELLLPDEVRRISRGKAVLLVANEPAVLDFKYNVKSHPAAKFTSLKGGKPFMYRYQLPRIFADVQRAQDYELLLYDELFPPDTSA